MLICCKFENVEKHGETIPSTLVELLMQAVMERGLESNIIRSKIVIWLMHFSFFQYSCNNNNNYY